MRAQINNDTTQTGSPRGYRLNRFDLLCLGVNAIVGSGIYILPGRLLALSGRHAYLAFAICGILSLSVAMSIATISKLFTRSGGPYLYATATFGSSVGFLVGWTCWIAAVASWAAVGSAFVDQVALLQPGLAGTWMRVSLSVGSVVVLTAVNYLGIRPGSLASNIFTIIKLLPIAAIIIAGGLFFVGLLHPASTILGRDATSSLSSVMQTPSFAWSKFWKSVFLAFFAYQGFEVIPVPAGKAKNPKKSVPFAVISSVAFVTVIYVVLQRIAVHIPSAYGSKEPLVAITTALIGGQSGRLVGIAAAISMLGFCAGVALAGPHYLVPIAEDGHIPDLVAYVHPRSQAPTIALLITAISTCALIVFVDFSRLLALSVIFVAAQYLSTTASVLRLTSANYLEKLNAAFATLLIIGVLVMQLIVDKASYAMLSDTLLLCLLGLSIRLLTAKFNKKA